MEQQYLDLETKTSIKGELDIELFWTQLLKVTRERVDLVPTNDLALDAQYRQARHMNRRQFAKLRDGHRDLFRKRLDKCKQTAKIRSVSDLLDDLESNWGMAWVDVARMVGVSVPALRKWRVGSSSASAENHERLAGIVAFFNALKAGGMQDPVSWLSMPLLDDYSATPRHLYSETREAPVALMDYAAGNISAVDILNELVPEWKTKYFSEYVAIDAGDGLLSLVNRASV